MGLFYDRVAMTVSGTPGTGVVTLGSAFTGHRSFADAGVGNATEVAYTIEDGVNWEVGKGTYSSTGPTLTRTTIYCSSNSNAAINASSAAVVFIPFTAEDISTGAAGSSGQIQYNNSGALGGMSGTAWDNTNRSLTITGATVTTNKPILDLSQTWNAAQTFTGLKLNVTDTSSNAASLLIDLQNGGQTRFSVAKEGQAALIGPTSSNFAGIYLARQGEANSMFGFAFQNTSYPAVYFGPGGATAFDTNFGRVAARTIQLGAYDAAAALAYTLQVMNVSTGTSNTAGANFTINGSRGTGTGAGGSIIFQVAPAGTTSSTQNPLAAALTIYSNKTVVVGATYTVATLPAAGTVGRRAWVTDATAPTFLGALTGGGAVVCPVFDNGTAWVSA